MNVSRVKFNTKDRPEFFSVLTRRVNAHFRENNIDKYANSKMVFKTVFMVALYFLPLIFMLVGDVQSTGLMFLLWTLMGFGMSGIGLSIMHDANHGAYSRNKNVNTALSFLLNFVGGYHINWRIQHNVLHHSFTNIHGHDEDIEKGVMRFCPTQERKPFFRFQLFYAPFLYGILTLYWVVGKDFEQLVRYRKKD
ncbi:MAG: fatty acid desaturase, partial [Bacteroidota bacterium]